MGKLIYGGSREIALDDYTLAHVKAAALTKLQLGEGFPFNWSDGHGRGTVWLHGTIPTQFVFDAAKRPDLNRAWVEALVRSANSADGMDVVPEPWG